MNLFLGVKTVNPISSQTLVKDGKEIVNLTAGSDIPGTVCK